MTAVEEETKLALGVTSPAEEKAPEAGKEAPAVEETAPDRTKSARKAGS
jgi:hypothetical protein